MGASYAVGIGTCSSSKIMPSTAARLASLRCQETGWALVNHLVSAIRALCYHVPGNKEALWLLSQ